MYVCVYACMHACMYVCIYLSISLSLSIYLSIYLSIDLSIYLSIYLSICLRMYRLCIYVCMYAWMYGCMYVCILVFLFSGISCFACRLGLSYSTLFLGAWHRVRQCNVVHTSESPRSLLHLWSSLPLRASVAQCGRGTVLIRADLHGLTMVILR